MLGPNDAVRALGGEEKETLYDNPITSMSVVAEYTYTRDLHQHHDKELLTYGVARLSRVARGLRVKIFTRRTKAFLWIGQVIVINCRRGARSYQFLVAAILDFFKMAAPKNECFYFLSYLWIHMRYLNDTGVYCDVFGVKKFECGVEMTIIVVAG